MKSSAATMALVFALAGGTVFAEESRPAECRSETERPMNIMELLQPIPQGQAVAFLLELDQGSPAWERLRMTPDQQLGAVLNELANGELNFDMDSAFRLSSQEVFEKIPHIVVHVCQPEGSMNVIEIAEQLKTVDGVLYAAPDSTLEEIPVIIERPAVPGIDI